jgi:phosphotransferase system HPr (HPr) family protein
MTATVVRRSVEVCDELGLHARPAADFAAAASAYDAEIQIGKADREVDAKSMLLILTLDVRKGDVIRLRAVGPDAEPAVAELVHRLAAP